jgi:hypothetical protein
MVFVHSYAVLHKPYLKNDKVAIEESMNGNAINPWHAFVFLL